MTSEERVATRAPGSPTRVWQQPVVAFLLLGGAVLVTIAIPPVYKASGLLLLESSQIPDERNVSGITGYADERVALLKQRVMTRENLLRVVDEFGLVPADQKQTASSSDLVEYMHKHVSVDLVDADPGRRRQGMLSIAFRVGFEHNSAETALNVTNELVKLFLDENVRTRTERAAETTAFLTDEAKKLRDDLEKIEAKLAEYKQKYGNALPEHLDLHLQMLERAEADSREVVRDLRALEEERRFLDLELAAVRRGDSAAGASGPAQELARARAELAAKRGVYSPDHPDLKYLERKVASLAGAAGSGRDDTSQVEQVRVEARIAAADTRLASLKSQREALNKKIDELQQVVIQTPQVERELQALSRDHENAIRKYQELKDKELGAKFAESQEAERKAERFSILEAPVLPDKPVKPDRKKLLATGTILALAGTGGGFLLVESFDQTLRGPQSLAKILGQSPLVRIPYVETRGEIRRRRRQLVYVLLMLLILILLAASAVHVLYMPLDQLWLKLLTRFG